MPGSGRAFRDLGRTVGLLDKILYEPGLVNAHDAELGCLIPVNLDAADGDRAVAREVLLEHHGVVHAVDVVSGEDEDVLRVVLPDDVEVR